MSENEITPALLRADADELRAVEYDASIRYGVQYGASIARAAAALEEQAARLEQGERVAALVPLARRALADGDWPTDVTTAARAALAAIAAEQTTTTGGQGDGA